MPRKARLLTSYPKQFFSIFEEAALRPLQIPKGTLKEAQYVVAELNQFRVSLRSALHPFYSLAESIIISARGDNLHGEIYMRTQENEWQSLNEFISPQSDEKGEEAINQIKQEQEELERAQLGAPQPLSENPFDRAMEMLKGEKK